jgi:diaminohydroxyphosphoribosylaminopyrimidine deaminase/5-amino-6-(5-phosphoribosylamino)uracil reductase
MDDKYFMKMALELARKGLGFTSPNPMVGAVIIKDGKIAGKGYHKAVGKAHAEINAINDAKSLASGGTLYVTLEPCNHTGRTLPCTLKIAEAGIKRVVIAMKDPNPNVKGGGIDYLKNKGIDVTLGICEDEAKKLNEAFIKFVETGSPFVTLKCAATLDGRIATRTGDARWVSGEESRTRTGDARWVSGEESRRFVHKLRHAADAIMVGVNTVKIDNPSLTTRLDDINGLDPVRIILDTNLSISEEARVLQLDSDSDTIIITCSSVSEDKKNRIEKKGAKIIEAPVRDGLIDLASLMVQLGTLGITSLLIEGGSRVNASALSAGIVDKAIFFYAPKILGGDDGIPMCMGPGPDLMKNCIPVKNINVHRFGDDVMIEGYIK